MTTDPATAKTYSYYGSNNQLWTVPSPFTAFSYDALDRLANFNTGAPVTNYVSDGSNIIAEYDGSNVLQKRYAFDPGSGEPLVAYDASGNRTWMVGDERGSVIALASDSGAMTAINTYDEYGIPGATNQGTFQYAGMLWLSRAGLYAPTFRGYFAGHGRFGQTDPIGMNGGVNLYAYVGGDPVNLVDLLGLEDKGINIPPCIEKEHLSCVTGTKLLAPLIGANGPNAPVPAGCLSAQCVVVVTAKRLPKALSPCQISFLASNLSRRGLPSNQLSKVRFVSGLDSKANLLTRAAFPSAHAVTQGTTIYVQPVDFLNYSNFRVPQAFEEIYHTSQFELNGVGDFYDDYGANWAGSFLTGRGGYPNFPEEAFAKGASQEMFNEAQSFMCKS